MSANNKDASLTIRISENQKKELALKAEAKGLSLSAYLSSLLKDYETKVSNNAQSEAEKFKLQISHETLKKQMKANNQTIAFLEEELKLYYNSKFEDTFDELKGKVVNGKVIKSKVDFLSEILKSLKIEEKPNENTELEILLQRERNKIIIPPTKQKSNSKIYIGIGVLTIGILIWQVVKKRKKEKSKSKMARQNLTKADNNVHRLTLEDGPKAKNTEKYVQRLKKRL